MTDDKLTAIADGAIIEPDESAPGAGTVIPEEAPAQADANAYDAIIESQNAQIAALIEQNRSLTNQITELVRNGAMPHDSQAPIASDETRPDYSGFTGFNGEPVSSDLRELGYNLAKRN